MTGPTKNAWPESAVLRWMRDSAQHYVDCGEVQCTQLVEEYCTAMGLEEWLDDPDHWVWDAAVTVAEEWRGERPYGASEATVDEMWPTDPADTDPSPEAP